MEKTIKLKSSFLSVLNEALQKMTLKDTIKSHTPVIVEADGKFTSIVKTTPDFNTSQLDNSLETEDEENKEDKEQLLNQAISAIKQSVEASTDLKTILNKIKKLSDTEKKEEWEVNEEGNTAELPNKGAKIFRQNNNICLSHEGKIELFHSVSELREWLKQNRYPLPGNISLHESADLDEGRDAKVFSFIPGEEGKKLARNTEPGLRFIAWFQDKKNKINNGLNSDIPEEKKIAEINLKQLNAVDFDLVKTKVKEFINAQEAWIASKLWKEILESVINTTITRMKQNKSEKYADLNKDGINIPEYLIEHPTDELISILKKHLSSYLPEGEEVIKALNFVSQEKSPKANVSLKGAGSLNKKPRKEWLQKVMQYMFDNADKDKALFKIPKIIKDIKEVYNYYKTLKNKPDTATAILKPKPTFSKEALNLLNSYNIDPNSEEGKTILDLLNNSKKEEVLTEDENGRNWQDLVKDYYNTQQSIQAKKYDTVGELKNKFKKTAHPELDDFHKDRLQKELDNAYIELKDFILKGKYGSKSVNTMPQYNNLLKQIKYLKSLLPEYTSSYENYNEELKREYEKLSNQIEEQKEQIKEFEDIKKATLDTYLNGQPHSEGNIKYCIDSILKPRIEDLKLILSKKKPTELTAVERDKETLEQMNARIKAEKQWENLPEQKELKNLEYQLDSIKCVDGLELSLGENQMILRNIKKYLDDYPEFNTQQKNECVGGGVTSAASLGSAVAYTASPKKEDSLNIFESATKHPWLNKLIGTRLVEDDTPKDFAKGSPIDSTSIDMSADTSTDNSPNNFSDDSSAFTADNLETDYSSEDDFGGITGASDFGDLSGSFGGYSTDDENPEMPAMDLPEYRIIDILMNDNDPEDIRVKIQDQDTKEVETKKLSEIDV